MRYEHQLRPGPPGNGRRQAGPASAGEHHAVPVPVERVPGQIPYTKSDDLVRLQRSVGNRGVAAMLRSTHPLQRDVAPPKGGASNDEGGAVAVTTLELDMRDILQEWQDGAEQGVAQFVTNNLSSRLDDLESGSWKTFLSSLIGNMIWAAAAFTPVGASVLAFRISMIGIGVAAVATTPRKSKDSLPEIQKTLIDYINGAFTQMNGQLRGTASALLAEHPDTTRYRAIAQIVRSSFAPGTYAIDASFGTIPSLDKSAIRDRFVSVASERLDIAATVGKAKVIEGGASEFGFNSTSVSEVAWVLVRTGAPRLAILDATWEGSDTRGAIPADASRTWKGWVSAESSEAAMAQWTGSRGVAPAVYDASQIDRLGS